MKMKNFISCSNDFSTIEIFGLFYVLNFTFTLVVICYVEFAFEIMDKDVKFSQGGKKL